MKNLLFYDELHNKYKNDKFYIKFNENLHSELQIERDMEMDDDEFYISLLFDIFLYDIEIFKFNYIIDGYTDRMWDLLWNFTGNNYFTLIKYQRKYKKYLKK